MSDIFDWSATAGNNTTVDGIGINTGMNPGNVDNAMRSIMALVRNTFVSGWQGLFAGTTSGIPVSNGAGTISTKAAPTGVIVGDTDTQTLTNKTLTGATIALGSNAGLTGTFAELNTAVTDADLQKAITITSNANGICISIEVSGTTYRLQFGAIPSLGVNGTTTLTYPVAFSTAVTSVVASKQVTISHDDPINLLNAPGLSTFSVANGGTATAGGFWMAMGY